MSEHVHVLGVAVRAPGADDVRAFWRSLIKGEISHNGPSGDGLWPMRQVRRVREFDAELMGVPAVLAAAMDPQQRALLELTFAAFEDAQLDPDRARGRVGIFVGGGKPLYGDLNVRRNREAMSLLGEQQVNLVNDTDFLAATLAYYFDTEGPAVSVQTACSSGLAAIHTAVRSIRLRECDIAVAGGVTVQLPPYDSYSFQDGGIVSHDGRARPFTDTAAGTVPASGGAVVVLARPGTTEASAPRAVVLGGGMSNDGHKRMSMAAPSPEGQARAIRAALADAEVSNSDVAFVETHGTGTRLGDEVELQALRAVYGERSERLVLGAVKTNVGHTDAAAGAIGFVKTVLALESGIIPPTPSQPADGPDITDWPFALNRAAESWADDTARIAGVSSFGLGGTNCHVILGAVPPEESGDVAGFGMPPAIPLVVSAASEIALRQDIERLEAIDIKPDELTNKAAVLHLGRKRLRYRSFLLLTDNSYVKTSADTGATSSGVRRSGIRDSTGNWMTVGLLAGQGAQVLQRGLSLARADQQFASDLDEVLALVQQAGGPSAAVMRRSGPDDSTAVVQPWLFALQVGLLKNLAHRGVRFDWLIGHSLGELAAAVHAQVMSLPDAARLVVVRAQAMEAAPSGAMLAVRADESLLAGLVSDYDLQLAVRNSPRSVVVAGSKDAVQEAQTLLRSAGVQSALLRVNHPFHTSWMTSAAREFEAAFAGVELAPPLEAVMSSAAGGPLTKEFATNPSFWAHQLFKPVNFAQAVGQVSSNRPLHAIEIGPGRVLLSHAEEVWAAIPRPVIASASLGDSPDEEERSFVSAVAEAWSTGQDVDFGLQQSSVRVDLPLREMAPTTYWIEPDQVTAVDTPVEPGGMVTGVTPDKSQDSVRVSDERHASKDLGDVLRDLWERVLGHAVGAKDNFFELGGTSLQATQLVTLVNEAVGVDLRLYELYEDATFESHIERVEALMLLTLVDDPSELLSENDQ